MSNNAEGSQEPNAAQGFVKKTGFFAKGFADDAGRALGNLGSAAFQTITTRKYTLPDKSVASQVLMYRQLLHTKCRPGLKLSRPYQATAAQKAVKHMPWWEEGIEQTEKMTISYDNLITRLWLNGAITPFQDSSNSENVETLIDEEGLPPIPHQHWVDRVGFQQPDPVTDFRSGGVLSLAMMVYMVESCPQVCQRLFTGDAAVLPFGITCINVTDMIAKFLMLAKSTDRMDALLSQKPFWRMFADPNAILAVQELAMTLLCDVVVEVSKERKIPSLARQHSSSMHGESNEVSVFDFSLIVERTETRVRDDLLGAGPKTVDELRSIAGRLRVKYQAQLDRRIERATKHEDQATSTTAPTPQIKDVVDKATGLAGGIAGGLLSKMKSPTFAGFGRKEGDPQPVPQETEPTATVVDLPAPAPELEDDNNTSVEEQEGDWLGTDIAPATEGITNFSIGDDDEEDIL